MDLTGVKVRERPSPRARRLEARPFHLELDGVMLKSSLRQHVDLNEKLRPNETRNQECCHGWANPGPPCEALFIQERKIFAPDHVVGESQNIGHCHLTGPQHRLDVLDGLLTLRREIARDRAVGAYADLAGHVQLTDAPQLSLHGV